jgi:DNA-binding transcriptional regulator YdaS (Cro superfamily)
MNNTTTALDDQMPIVIACESVGGQAVMARLLGITPAAVNQWCSAKRSVPAERCPDIEHATRQANAMDATKRIVTCEQLCPSVSWNVLRNRNAAPVAPLSDHRIASADRRAVDRPEWQGAEQRRAALQHPEG